MRLAYGQIRNVNKETLTNTRQMEMGRIQFNLPHNLPAGGLWKHEDLVRFRDTCDRYGIIVEAMENMPIFLYDRTMLGLKGRDRQTENVCESIRSLGWAGIPVLGYHFSPSFVWRADNHTPVGRYGATVQAFDLEMQKQGVDDMNDFEQRRDVAVPGMELLWEDFGYFMKRVMPVAEEYNVTIVLHPDDPPVKSLSDIARMFIDLDSYKRAGAMIDNPSQGLLFYIGTLSQMKGGARNIFDAIKYFGPKKRLVYTHIRDVRGTVPEFQECFLGEGGFDPFEVVYKLMYPGFDGFLVSDHVPSIEGDREWGHKTRYADTAYIKSLMEAIGKMEAAKQVWKNLQMICYAWIKDGKEG